MIESGPEDSTCTGEHLGLVETAICHGEGDVVGLDDAEPADSRDVTDPITLELERFALTTPSGDGREPDPGGPTQVRVRPAIAEDEAGATRALGALEIGERVDQVEEGVVDLHDEIDGNLVAQRGDQSLRFGDVEREASRSIEVRVHRPGDPSQNSLRWDLGDGALGESDRRGIREGDLECRNEGAQREQMISSFQCERCCRDEIGRRSRRLLRGLLQRMTTVEQGPIVQHRKRGRFVGKELQRSHGPRQLVLTGTDSQRRGRSVERRSDSRADVTCERTLAEVMSDDRRCCTDSLRPCAPDEPVEPRPSSRAQLTEQRLANERMREHARCVPCVKLDEPSLCSRFQPLHDSELRHRQDLGENAEVELATDYSRHGERVVRVGRQAGEPPAEHIADTLGDAELGQPSRRHPRPRRL